MRIVNIHHLYVIKNERKEKKILVEISVNHSTRVKSFVQLTYKNIKSSTFLLPQPYEAL